MLLIAKSRINALCETINMCLPTRFLALAAERAPFYPFGSALCAAAPHPDWWTEVFGKIVEVKYHTVTT